MSKEKDQFFKNLDIVLLKKGMNKSSLAIKLNVTRAAVSNWYQRNSVPSIKIIKEISQALEIDSDVLISGNLEDQTSAFDKFIDDLAHKELKDAVLKEYEEHGSPGLFMKIMIENHDTENIAIPTWYIELLTAFKKYVNLDLVHKIQSKINGKQS